MTKIPETDIVLLCGGKGTRLQEFTADTIPKSLFRIAGRTLLQYTLDTLDSDAIGKQIFAVDHHAEQLQSWVESHNQNSNTTFSYQTEPGIVGAIKAAKEHISTDYFVVCNTDEIRQNFSANTFLQTAYERVAQGEGAMATAYGDNLFQHRVIRTAADNKITDTELKNGAYRDAPQEVGLINTGFLLLPTSYIDEIDTSKGNDWSSVIDPLVEQQRLYSVASQAVRYFNVGTPAEVAEATDYLSNSAE